MVNAARNSFSFFLLLIVCLGYGVVKPTLGKTMLIVRGLAATHFVFGVIYAIASLSITPENAGMLFLLPLSSPTKTRSGGLLQDTLNGNQVLWCFLLYFHCLAL